MFTMCLSRRSWGLSRDSPKDLSRKLTNRTSKSYLLYKTQQIGHEDYYGFCTVKKETVLSTPERDWKLQKLWTTRISTWNRNKYVQNNKRVEEVISLMGNTTCGITAKYESRSKATHHVI